MTNKHAGPWMSFHHGADENKHHRIMDVTDDADPSAQAQVTFVLGRWWRPGHGFIE